MVVVGVLFKTLKTDIAIQLLIFNLIETDKF